MKTPSSRIIAPSFGSFGTLFPRSPSKSRDATRSAHYYYRECYWHRGNQRQADTLTRCQFLKQRRASDLRAIRLLCEEPRRFHKVRGLDNCLFEHPYPRAYFRARVSCRSSLSGKSASEILFIRLHLPGWEHLKSSEAWWLVAGTSHHRLPPRYLDTWLRRGENWKLAL